MKEIVSYDPCFTSEMPSVTTIKKRYSKNLEHVFNQQLNKTNYQIFHRVLLKLKRVKFTDCKKSVNAQFSKQLLSLDRRVDFGEVWEGK